MTDASGAGSGDTGGGPPPPLATLGYAGASSDSLPANVSALPLLIPNLAAVVVLVLPLHNSEPPIGPVLDYVRALFSQGRAEAITTMDALITGPFLLAIPLAVWTARLALAPRPRPAERWIAWSLALVSMTMTAISLVYCVVSVNHRRFLPAVAMAIVVIALGSTGVALLWRLRKGWPPALLAMTAAWAANTTMTMLVLLSHTPWNVGIALGLTVVAVQVILGVVCVLTWRAAAPAT